MGSGGSRYQALKPNAARTSARDICPDKLDALQVSCRQNKIHWALDAPNFLHAEPIHADLKRCCRSVGNRSPRYRQHMTLWYVSDPSGAVRQLGPADIGLRGKPTHIYNLIGPDELLPPGVVHKARQLGEIHLEDYKSTPALAIVIGRDGKLGCHLGRLFGNSTVPRDEPSGLRFIPCGTKTVYKVRREQVALLETMPQGMSVCLSSVGGGGAPGPSAPRVVQEARTRRASGALKEGRQAAQSCAATAATLTRLITEALEVMASKAPPRVQRRAVKAVKDEITHASAHAPHPCTSAALDFVRVADRQVCLREINDALQKDGVEAIEGATAEEEAHTVKRLAMYMETHYPSLASTRVLNKCLSLFDPGAAAAAPSQLDAACAAVPGMKASLQHVHDAPNTHEKRRAIAKLLRAIKFIQNDPNAEQCRDAAVRFLTSVDQERCREVLGARPGIDERSAALSLAAACASGQCASPTCEQYNCLKAVDERETLDLAEEAIQSYIAHHDPNSKRRLSKVRRSCADFDALPDALTDLTSDDAWESLATEAVDHEESDCFDAAADYVVNVFRKAEKADKLCSSKKQQ